MNADIILYESGVLVLVAAVIFMGLALKKLTMIVKENKSIWLLPIAAGAVLAVSLGAHAYASFILLPEMSVKISQMSSADVIANPAKLDAIRPVILALKSQLVGLKAASFTCFFLASLLLLISTSVYIRWISK
jgi:hypothetical protein